MASVWVGKWFILYGQVKSLLLYCVKLHVVLAGHLNFTEGASILLCIIGFEVIFLWCVPRKYFLCNGKLEHTFIIYWWMVSAHDCYFAVYIAIIFNLMLNTLFSVITAISIVTLSSSCLLILTRCLRYVHPSRAATNLSKGTRNLPFFLTLPSMDYNCMRKVTCSSHLVDKDSD